MGERKGLWTILLTGLGILLVGGVIVLPFTMLLAMASDNCHSSRQRPICAPTVQFAVGYGPIGALAVALLVGALGGGRAVVTGRGTVLSWVFRAWGLFLAYVTGALVVAFL